MGKTQGFRFDSAAVERFGVRFRQCFRRVIRQLARKNKGVSHASDEYSAWKEGKMPMISIALRPLPHQKRRGYGCSAGLIGTKRGQKSNVFRCRRRCDRPKAKGFSMVFGWWSGQKRAKPQCF